MANSILIIIGISMVPFISFGLQFPWAEPQKDATDSPFTIWDLRRPEFPAELVQEFLNRSVPGVDYPSFQSIPQTNFSCLNVEQPGYYADPEAGCQVYHRCDPGGRKFTYMCGNQTIFDQLLLTCDFFYKVDCPKAKEYFNFANSNLYGGSPLLKDRDQHTG